jgi:hypothetical protein
MQIGPFNALIWSKTVQNSPHASVVEAQPVNSSAGLKFPESRNGRQCENISKSKLLTFPQKLNSRC